MNGEAVGHNVHAAEPEFKCVVRGFLSVWYDLTLTNCLMLFSELNYAIQMKENGDKCTLVSLKGKSSLGTYILMSFKHKHFHAGIKSYIGRPLATFVSVVELRWWVHDVCRQWNITVIRSSDLAPPSRANGAYLTEAVHPVTDSLAQLPAIQYALMFVLKCSCCFTVPLKKPSGNLLTLP